MRKFIYRMTAAFRVHGNMTMGKGTENFREGRNDERIPWMDESKKERLSAHIGGNAQSMCAHYDKP